MSAVTKVKLQSSDGVVFTLDVEVAKQSNMFRTMLEDMAPDEEEEVVQLPNVTGDILEKVIAWATAHKDDDPACGVSKYKRRAAVSAAALSPGDADLLAAAERDLATLLLLIQAANALGIDKLLDLLAMGMANVIRGKTPEEIRKVFASDLRREKDEVEQLCNKVKDLSTK
jgi:S-phase kinase-associated protein 1